MWGRIIVLLVLILVLVGGGIIWFDYLNVIDAKYMLALVYRLLGKEPRLGGAVEDDMFLNLDEERLRVRLEALALKELDLDSRDEDLKTRQAELDQLSQTIEEDRKILEEIEISIKQTQQSAEILDRNVEGVSQRLTNMQPERAVRIILAMTDQTAVSVLRKTEELAVRDGTGNLVPYWLSLMAATDEGASRAAELQRKMVTDIP